MTEQSIPQRTDSWEGSLSLAKRLNARYGMACFPATGAPRQDDPASPQKMPRIAAWQKNAAATPEAMDALWGTVRNQGGCYLVGVLCSGLIVIDVDTPDGHAAAVDARPQWEAWQNEYGRTPTLTVRTQSGGLHIYYRLPAGCTVPVRSGSSRLAPGIDHKTTGGYTVAPGNTFSINGETRQYQVLEEGPEEKGWIADAPDWLIARLAALYGGGTASSGKEAMACSAVNEEERRRRERPGWASDFGVDMSDAAGRGDEPDCADTAADAVQTHGKGAAPLSLRTEQYVKKALAGACREIASAEPGTRNHTLNGKTLWIMRLWLWGTRNNGMQLEQGWLVQEMMQAAGQAGLPGQEAAATISSAIRGAERCDEPDKIREMREQDLDRFSPASHAAQTAPGVRNQAAPAAGKAAQKETAGPRIFTEYYEAASLRISLGDEYGTQARDYLQSRGISEATMARFKIGCDPFCDPVNAPGQLRDRKPADSGRSHVCPRLIIPVSRTHYIARSTDPATPEKYIELSPKGSRAGIFNVQVLKQDGGTIIVTDAVLSALTYMEAGASALATVSLANVGELVKLISRQQCTATFILAFSGNDAGRQAKIALSAEMRRRSIPFLIAPPSVTGRGAVADGLTEDANDLFVLDREAFLAALKRVRSQAGARPDNMHSYLCGRMQDDIARYRGSISTGFRNLDALSYGLYPGLYVIGAISSLGKTTFAWQICDHAAAAGEHVLFFSLEMSCLELASKSVNRRAHLIDPATDSTALKVRTQPWTDLVAQAVAEYDRDVGERISVVEGNLDTDITSISETVRRYMKMNQDVHPVVVVDYLQILKPAEDESLTDKQKVDANMTELKRMSRDLGVPVIVISSLNRTNYMTPIDFDAFKESGGIEYTADVIWGLQLMCLESEVFHSREDVSRKKEIIREEKKRPQRYIELVCLKNRYGISSFRAFFAYTPAADLFEEISPEEAQRCIDALDLEDGAEAGEEARQDVCSVDLSHVTAWKERAGRKKGR